MRTLSAHETAHLHWSVPDPVGQPESAFMDAFDTIEDRVEQLSRSDTGGFMNDVPTRRSGLTLDQQLALRTAAGRLQERFDGVFSTETLERFLHHSYDEFADRAAVAQWLPLMAERFATQRLTALARIEGRSSDTRPVVLFLCVHNAGRSQMALGFFENLAGDRVIGWSGGSQPASTINPAAIEAMAERGIDISREFPKPWTDEGRAGR